MKTREQFTKWAVVVLGLVSLAFGVNLARNLRRARLGTPAQAAGGAKVTAPSRTAQSKTGLSRYDPALNLDLLNKLLKRPLPPVERNPFAFATSIARATTPAVSQNAAPAPPAPPPPPPLKAVGYMEMPGGAHEAYVSYADQVYTVQEGDTIANKFSVVKVTSSQVEVLDATTKETIKLPISQ